MATLFSTWWSSRSWFYYHFWPLGKHAKSGPTWNVWLCLETPNQESRSPHQVSSYEAKPSSSPITVVMRNSKQSTLMLIRNNRSLTSLTLSCELGRDTMFTEMLEMSCIEFWRWYFTFFFHLFLVSCCIGLPYLGRKGGGLCKGLKDKRN